MQTGVYSCRRKGQELTQGAQTPVVGRKIQAAVATNNRFISIGGLRALWECTLGATVMKLKQNMVFPLDTQAVCFVCVLCTHASIMFPSDLFCC